jgi:hypothetical protein
MKTNLKGWQRYAHRVPSTAGSDACELGSRMNLHQHFSPLHERPEPQNSLHLPNCRAALMHLAVVSRGLLGQIIQTGTILSSNPQAMQMPRDFEFGRDTSLEH